MRRVLAATIAAAALAGATAGPASADILSDLGVSTEGLTTLPAGFDPLTNLDVLSIDTNIVTLGPLPYPIDMTTGTMRNPPGTPIKPTSRASKKRKKTRRARRG